MIDMERYKKNRDGGFEGVLMNVAKHNVWQGHCGCYAAERWYRDGLDSWYKQSVYKQQNAKESVFEQTGSILMQCLLKKMFDRDNKYGRDSENWAPKSVWNFKNSVHTQCDLNTMPYCLLQELRNACDVSIKERIIKYFSNIANSIKQNPRCIRVVKEWTETNESVEAVCAWIAGANEIFNDEWVGFGCCGSTWYRTKLFKVYMKASEQKDRNGKKSRAWHIEYGMYPCVDTSVDTSYYQEI